MTYKFAGYNYIKKDGNERSIIVHEKAWGPLDKAGLYDFTPKYVENMDPIERRKKNFYSYPYHTHTRVFDLEKNEWRTLIKNNIVDIVRNHDDPHSILKYKSEGPDFQEAIKEFRNNFLTPFPSVLFNGFDEEVEGETILPIKNTSQHQPFSVENEDEEVEGETILNCSKQAIQLTKDLDYIA